MKLNTCGYLKTIRLSKASTPAPEGTQPLTQRVTGILPRR